MKAIATVLAACAVLSAALPASAAKERGDAWGKGGSEFEAVKSAYQQLVSQALDLTSTDASAQSPVRRVFMREVEEDLLRVQSTYFPGAPAPRCTEEREVFECQVVARADMDEINARVRDLLDQTGDDLAVHDLRIGLVSKEVDTSASDLLDYLHSQLEGTFGHDVLRARAYVDIHALRDGCRDYERLAKEAEARGDSHVKIAESARASLAACRDLRDRDLVIVLDDAQKRFGEFSGRTDGMRGEITVRMQIHMTTVNRPLPAPRPHTITQFGYGDDAGFARSEVNNRLNEAATHHIVREMNGTFSRHASDGRARPAAPVERQYAVLVSGVNPDDASGRAQLQLVTNWFASTRGLPLEAQPWDGFGERRYTFRSSNKPNWADMTDQLYGTLDQAKQFARIDVDRSRNFTITFQPNDALKAKQGVEVVVEAKRAQRRIAIDDRSMEVRRRHPESGAAIAVNEAVLRIRNKTGRDLLITVNPVWRGQDGSSLPAPHSYRQTVRLPAKTSERFAFMAPSRFAGPVTIELSCPEDRCEMPR